MLQIFIIVFREILEISVIIGLVLAATKGLKNRNKWVICGILFGLLGSILIALFTSNISNAIEGQGQEVFNAIIISIITILLIWTVVWMKSHGQNITKKIKHVSQKIHEGESSFIPLMFVIASTIFREGAEIVLFAYGSYAAHNLSLVNIMIGAGGGLVVGSIVGITIYQGLICFTGKYIFQVTALLLSFIAAGMASQAINFLHASGLLNIFSYTLWNSSNLIADSSILGQFLNILLGYDSQPTVMQVIVYCSTLLVIYLLIKLQSKSS
jgi:high-affinity iron transporter